MDVRTRTHEQGESSATRSDADLNRVAEAEALLSTIVGIAGVRVLAHPAGGIAVVRVDCDEDVTLGQVLRNVRSALFAGLGISISPECIDFVQPDELAGPADPAASAAVPVPAPVDASDAIPAPRLMHVLEAKDDAAAREALAGGTAERTPGNAVRSYEAPGQSVRELIASNAALRLESLELRRQAGRTRCRVVMALGNDHFGAVAASTDPEPGDLHLAGRVACDALRAGGFTDARFDGATVARINGREHVVVALSQWQGGETLVLSGAAPIEEAPERAAAIAAIKAVLAQDIN